MTRSRKHHREQVFSISLSGVTNEQALSVKCPYHNCSAAVGKKCISQQWTWDEKTMRSKKSSKREIAQPHHDRRAVSVGLKIEKSTSVYKIDLDLFAKLFPVTFEQAERLSVLWAERAAELAKKE